DELVTYTVAATNISDTDIDEAVLYDDLSKVNDDAEYVDGSGRATIDGAAVAAPTYNAGNLRLTWQAPIPAGKTVYLTYQVRSRTKVSGNGLLANRITANRSNCEFDSTDADCATEVRVVDPPMTVTKKADKRTAGARSVVTYTVTVDNPGSVKDPVTVTDDLSQVLDAATFVTGSAKATVDGAEADGPEFDAEAKRLTWRHRLPKGAKLVLTYQVRAATRPEGDRQLDNKVTVTGDSPTDKSNCLEGSTDSACQVSVPLTYLSRTKEGRPEVVRPGKTYSYSVSATNQGTLDLTGADQAVLFDDMTDVLDDADYDQNATVVEGPQGTFEFVPGKGLRWRGDLKAGETVRFTYSITVKRRPTGNMKVVNTLRSETAVRENNRARRASNPLRLRAALDPEPGADTTDPSYCENGDGDCSTTGNIPYLDGSKKADRTRAMPGDTVNYTWTIKSTGSVDVPGSEEDGDWVKDPITDILKYADYNDDIKVSEGTGTASFTDGALKWTGPLKKGAQVVVSFSVTVRENALEGLGADATATMPNTLESEYNCPKDDPKFPAEEQCKATVTIVPKPPKPSPTPTPTPKPTPTPTPTPTKTPVPPSPSPSPSKTPVLPDTGADEDTLIGFAGAAAGLVALGGLAFTIARRRRS
ncbi:MAG TPA: isopeptide-forming domain-containing fimbrial protein, partial [Streptomyces sp.]